ncbi:MAG: glycosyltransferase, partial [Albidovulum sp.]
LNYLRLSRALKPGDRLVFDGGYVFDSVLRVIFEKELDAVWIRRGLWQAGQLHGVTLDRERAFTKVIVPGEAFPELNGDRGGAKVHSVGPVVQRRALPDAAARKAARNALAERLGTPFDELFVTMLGGGVAADRTAQTQTVAAITERRKGCLNLVVVWPGTVVHPGLWGLQNTRVVQTRNALALCLLADLVVSAAGYNSFHEILYHGIPAIFVPQMAAFMDDQERRARSASDRGLAECVLAHEMLLLHREITAFVDGGKADRVRAALAAVTLPETGNRAAAALICESEAP